MTKAAAEARNDCCPAVLLRHEKVGARRRRGCGVDVGGGGAMRSKGEVTSAPMPEGGEFLLQLHDTFCCELRCELWRRSSSSPPARRRSRSISCHTANCHLQYQQPPAVQNPVIFTHYYGHML